MDGSTMMGQEDDSKDAEAKAEDLGELLCRLGSVGYSEGGPCWGQG